MTESCALCILQGDRKSLWQCNLTGNAPHRTPAPGPMGFGYAPLGRRKTRCDAAEAKPFGTAVWSITSVPCRDGFNV
jgi:hypothetical protein